MCLGPLLLGFSSGWVHSSGWDDLRSSALKCQGFVTQDEDTWQLVIKGLANLTALMCIDRKSQIKGCFWEKKIVGLYLTFGGILYFRKIIWGKNIIHDVLVQCNRWWKKVWRKTYLAACIKSNSQMMKISRHVTILLFKKKVYSLIQIKSVTLVLVE